MAALAVLLDNAVLPLLGFLGFAVAYWLGGALKESGQMQSEAIRRLAFFGHILVGAAAGGMSLLVYQPSTVVPALALLAVPLLLGLTARLLGDLKYGIQIDRSI